MGNGGWVIGNGESVMGNGGWVIGNGESVMGNRLGLRQASQYKVNWHIYFDLRLMLVSIDL
ncbi:hypothetical protein [Tolypothrix sp. NIES-4075]|uniref:hypothetical protein n=1 Tax=Tolypothrix sp. NIES-4075 TaxID=2005459 RepID=UPI000B5CC708|nr:hypothetical protein [Tolypothrix sp. NIES-4075]